MTNQTILYKGISCNDAVKKTVGQKMAMYKGISCNDAVKKTVGQKMAMAVRSRGFCVFMASARWFNPVSVYKKRCNRKPPVYSWISFRGARARGGSITGDLGFTR
jgi:hypothetical protein